MEYTDVWFIQQGVGPIKGLTLRHTLHCIAADTKYLNIYLDIYV